MLFLGWKVTSSNAFGSFFTWALNSLKIGGFSSDGLLSSRCAKNASTITIRIGKAALRKNRLMADQSTRAATGVAGTHRIDGCRRGLRIWKGDP